MNIIEELKALPFTVQAEKDSDGVFLQVKEFSTVLVSSEDELLTCLKNSKPESIYQEGELYERS